MPCARCRDTSDGYGCISVDVPAFRVNIELAFFYILGLLFFEIFFYFKLAFLLRRLTVFVIHSDRVLYDRIDGDLYPVVYSTLILTLFTLLVKIQTTKNTQCRYCGCDQSKGIVRREAGIKGSASLNIGNV